MLAFRPSRFEVLQTAPPRKAMMKSSNYLLFLGSILIALLIAEVLLRTFVPEIGWAQRKDAVVGWSSDEYKEFDPEDSEDGAATRILFLGDSFLAGSGVSALDKRFPVLLQSQLARTESSRILAAGGWGTDQQLIAFVQKGIPWKPDLVILAFCANNDISNILSNSHGLKKRKPYFVLEDSGSLRLYDGYGNPLDSKSILHTEDAHRNSDSPQVRSYLFDFTRLILRFLASPDQSAETEDQAVDARYLKFRYWEEKREEIFRQQDRLSWSPQNGVNHASAYIHENFEINTYQWRLFESILAKLKEEVESSGGKLVLMLLPVIFNPADSGTIAGGSFVKEFQTPDGSFTFRSVEPRERLQTISDNTGITFLDPTQDFINMVLKNNLMKQVWPENNRHFSDLGHEIMANLLEDHIEALVKNDRTTAERNTLPVRNGATHHSDE